MKNEISKKNPYWIPKHRYLELKNWCLQYLEWIEFMSNARYIRSKIPGVGKSQNISDPTGDLAVKLHKADLDTHLIEEICLAVAPDYFVTFLYGITWGASYDYMITQIRERPNFPSRSEWYKTRRKFFYILSQKRD